MEMRELVELGRNMVVLFHNKYITPCHQYGREIDIHSVAIDTYEEGTNGELLLSLSVIGEEDKEFCIKWNPYAEKIESYILD